MFNSLLRKGLASRIFAYAEPCVRLWDAVHAESDTTAVGLKAAKTKPWQPTRRAWKHEHKKVAPLPLGALLGRA